MTNISIKMRPGIAAAAAGAGAPNPPKAAVEVAGAPNPPKAAVEVAGAPNPPKADTRMRKRIVKIQQKYDYKFQPKLNLES
jgi:hypothetical protein